MGEELPLLFVCALANLNTVSAVLYYCYHPFISSDLQFFFLLGFCAQFIALYISYLRTAWLSLQNTLTESSPGAVLRQSVALTGCLPVYIALGVLKLLPFSFAFLYVAPRSITSQRWTIETRHFPVLFQGFLQCFPGLIVAALNDFDATDTFTLLYAWSAVAMLIVSALSLRQVLHRLPRRDF